MGHCSGGRRRREYLVVVAEPVVALVGDDDAGFFGVDSCVWEVLEGVSGGGR